MKLYHGTSESRLQNILRRGIIPRREDGKHNWENAPSNPDAVYLTTAYAPYFALMSSGDNERMVILEIDTDLLDSRRFCPDEDFLEQASRAQDREEAARMFVGKYAPSGHPEWARLHDDVKENVFLRTAKYREVMHSQYADKWEMSVQHMGTCAYVGVIPASAISRYSLYDPYNVEKSTPAITEQLVAPLISIGNYKFMGDFYKNFTLWFFGKRCTWSQLRYHGYDENAVKALEDMGKTVFLHNGGTPGEYETMKQTIEDSLLKHGGLEVWQRRSKTKFSRVL
jgi:hypothetical protein